jgi:membrane protein implicated in regulation of membrane protease activity
MLLLGGLWIFQGIGVAKGSFMTGHIQWTYIGAVVAVAGVALIVAGRRYAARRDRESLGD